MEELKRFELNNKVMQEFDKLMTFHLDQVEELVINEIFINPKLYNIISLCTNLKTLNVSGDLRVDINKIIFNICKPEKLETLILNSVKLPTSKSLVKFTNIQTLSLNNITFSDVNGFFNRIVNKEKIIALNLTNVDLGRKSISICKQFENLKYLNLDNIKNCKFDDFEFIYENKNIKRFEFFNNEIDFDKVNILCKGRYTKNIEVNLKTSNECNITNSFEINSDGEISLTVNTADLVSVAENVSFYKLTNLFIILGNDIEIEKYIRNFKKVKGKVTLAINDIAYLDVDVANRFRDRLNVEYINIFDNNQKFDTDNSKFCYTVEEYIEIRSKIDDIISKISEHSNEIDKFNELYSYFKNNFKFDDDESNIKKAIIDNMCSYNLFAIIMNSCLKIMNIESKIIGGRTNEEELVYWNQVNLDGDWYNFDLGNEMKLRYNKKIFKIALTSNLLNDDQFYKNHTPQFGDIEICSTQIVQKKKELKDSVKKVKFFEKVILKLKGIFKLNKKKELPAPENNNKD